MSAPLPPLIYEGRPVAEALAAATERLDAHQKQMTTLWDKAQAFHAQEAEVWRAFVAMEPEEKKLMAEVDKLEDLAATQSVRDSLNRPPVIDDAGGSACPAAFEHQPSCG